MVLGLQLNGVDLPSSIFGADGSVDCLCTIFQVTTTPSTVRIVNLNGVSVTITGTTSAIGAYVSIKRIDF